MSDKRAAIAFNYADSETVKGSGGGIKGRKEKKEQSSSTDEEEEDMDEPEDIGKNLI
jgi:hypothetical protein